MVEDSCYICGRSQKDLEPFFGDKIRVIEDELKQFADIDKKVKNYEKKLIEFLKKSEDKSIWDLSFYLEFVIDPTASHMLSNDARFHGLFTASHMVLNDARIHGLLPIIKQFKLAESAEIKRERKNTGSESYTSTNLWNLRKEVKEVLSADHPKDEKYLVSMGLITEGDEDRNFNDNYLQEERYSAYANLLNLKRKMELEQIELDFDHFLHDARSSRCFGFNTEITKIIGDDDWPDLFSEEKHKEILEKLGHFTLGIHNEDIHNENFVSESSIKVKICPICQTILPYGEDTYEDDDPYDGDDRGRDYEGPEVAEHFDDANE